MTTDRAPTIEDAATALDAARFGRPASGWRRKLYVVIFEANTPAGLLFDQALLVAILASVVVVTFDISYSARRCATADGRSPCFFRPS
jgi:voltage-gated potassium channel